jgi:Holliday junction DNA helicase RuvA
VIGYISGKILEVSDASVLVLTSSWVGYEIGINEISFATLATREEADLYIYHHITEWGQSLFGFETIEEKKLFTELIKISGVGWKVALQIMSLGKYRLIEAVQNDDKKTIESIKWIGKKMAEKIVLELKDKDFVKSHVWEWIADKTNPEQISLPATLIENITGTLQNMGYQARDIERVLVQVPAHYSSVEEILPFMIRELS